MKQETREYLTKVERLFEAGRIHISMFDDLLDEWSLLIDYICSQNENTKQAYLKLNQLKLSVKWYEQQHSPHQNKQLQDFIQYLIDFVDVEIKSLRLHPEKEGGLSDAKVSKQSELRWAAKKRDLIELICALNELGCINEGKVPFKRQVVLFEEVFKINLGNVHSELFKMTSRKPLNDSLKRAYFISKLSHKFNEKLLKK